MGDAIRQLVLLRIRTFLREPEALFWTFGFPVLLTLALGVAFGTQREEPETIGLLEGTRAVEHLDRLRAEPELRVLVLPAAEAELALARGEIVLLLGGTDRLEARFDPARTESRVPRLLVERAIGGPPEEELLEIPQRERGSRYIDWVIPGLIGMNLMSTGLWAIGFGIVDMRKKKQLKRLSATPMRRSDFLTAQVLARVAFLLLEVPPIMLFAWWFFGVQVEGALSAVLVVILLGTMTFTGLGLLAAARARTVEGVSGLMNVIMLPMFIFSGVFFSASRFPEAAQPLIQALPLTAFNDALRAVYNEGLPLTAVPGELAILLLWTLGSGLLALRIFRWS